MVVSQSCGKQPSFSTVPAHWPTLGSILEVITSSKMAIWATADKMTFQRKEEGRKANQSL
jgi:hypothetical protein